METFGEVHQSNQTLVICNSFIQLWAISNILFKAGPYGIEILAHLEMSRLTIRALFKFG